jgi:hypothetical protein
MEPGEAVRLIKELEEEIDSSAGGRLVRTLLPVRMSYSIFMGNARDLGQVFALHASGLGIPVLWDVRNRALLDAFLLEAARRLHNYVASAMSLVEHTRQAIRRIYPDAQSPGRIEYEARVRSDFANSPESQFVQDLRDFILHVDAPSIIARSRWDRKTGEHRELLLPRKRLATWDRWSPLAKEFLDSATEDVSLDPLITSYTARVETLYVWFAQWSEDQHAPALSELGELRARVRQLVLDGGLAGLDDESTRPRSPEEIRQWAQAFMSQQGAAPSSSMPSTPKTGQRETRADRRRRRFGRS